ncbi:MAG TPA: response regulator [Tepidisphaeraceae bacterium]|nr:response regulator [Tepidisphaeraceae bacterium]
MKQTHGPHQQRVLLIEDETRLRDMLLRAMREMGFNPTGVASAEAALRLMEPQPFPVLIIDLNLPGAGGMELLATVRQRWPETQAIILTGFGDLSAARQAIRLEVVDFLTKPCGLGDLEAALGRAFRRLQNDLPAALAQAHRGTDENEPEPKSDPSSTPRPRATFQPIESREGMSLEDVERELILSALERHAGNRPATAKELGISVRKLYYRLSQYQSRGPET